MKKNVIRISKYLSYPWQRRICLIRVLLLILSIALTAFVSVQLVEKKEQKELLLLYQSYFESAVNAQEAENYYEAEVNYRKMLALIPGDALAYDGIAAVLELTRNYEGALELRKEQAEISQDEEIQQEVKRLENKWSELQQSVFEKNERD